MAVDNEIVRFIAKLDLDPETAKGFQQQLERSDKYCEELRQEIDRTIKSMIEMKANSEANSDAYKKQEQHLAELRKTYKDAQKETQKYSQALGVNKMSMQELRVYARQLRQALDSMHKETNPALWKKYSDELAAAEKRMKSLRTGTEKTGGVFSALKNKVVPSLTAASLAIKGIDAAIGLAKKALKDMVNETQRWGDSWRANVAGLDAGWHQLIANMSSGRHTINGSVSDAVRVAKEVAKLKDELFEMDNSLRIAQAEAQEYINEQEAIAMNASKTAEERLQAMDNIKTKRLELLATEETIAAQERTIALETIQQRTSLNEDNLKVAIDAYNANRDAFHLAEEYNKLLETRDLRMRDIADQSAITRNWAVSEVERLNVEMAKTPAIVQQYAAILRQYNLGNDAMVKSYVDATIHVQEVANQRTAIDRDQARRRGTLENQIRADQKAAAERAYNERIKAADEAYKQELLLLKQRLLQGEITEAQFHSKSLTAEMVMLQNKIAINQAYGKSTIDLETKNVDQRLAIQQKLQDTLRKSDEEFRKEMERQDKEMAADVDRYLESLLADVLSEIEGMDIEDPVRQLADLMDRHKDDEMQSRSGKVTAARMTFDAEMADLDELHDRMLISEEEFLARKKNLHEEYARTIAEINLATWQNVTEIAGQFLEQAGTAVAAFRDAETASLDAQMEAELAAAGDNAEERERIEAEYEAKKLETQKKYADVDMAINIAKTIAAGALAAMQSFAQLGPIAGAVMAAVIGVTTAAEVATIVAQRNAIKNASASSASGTVGTTGSVGFSEGGYTGDGGRLQVAGVVHRGEYVVAAPELRDPYVARQIAGIERMRLARTGGKSRYQGFADGGYTMQGQQPDNTGNAILEDIYSLLTAIAGNPIPAYVVLSDLEAKYDESNRFKTVTSLRKSSR